MLITLVKVSRMVTLAKILGKISKMVTFFLNHLSKPIINQNLRRLKACGCFLNSSKTNIHCASFRLKSFVVCGTLHANCSAASWLLLLLLLLLLLQLGPCEAALPFANCCGVCCCCDDVFLSGVQLVLFRIRWMRGNWTSCSLARK